MSSQPHEPTQADTLRDARLVRALLHMPDAHLQPDALVRSRVLLAAQQALHNAATPTDVATEATPAAGVTKPVPSRWHWLFGQPGDRVPWSGALASVLLASLITVMWTGRDLPEAQPQGDTASTPANTGTRAAMTAAAPTPVAAATQESLPASPAPTPAPALAPAPAPIPEHAAKPVISQPALAGKATAAPPVKSVARDDVRVSIDGKAHTLTPDKASALLITLRTLPEPPATDHAAATRQDTQERAGKISSANGQDLLEQPGALPVFTVETTAGERWDISEQQVRTYTGDKIRLQPLTRAQWLQLRQLLIADQ
jgi:hypothetical protein